MRQVLLFLCALLLVGTASATCPHIPSRDARFSSPPININQADAATLQQGLVGIGETKAKAIVAWRAQHGAFRSLDELTEVKGIGPALLAKNRTKIRL